MAEKDPIEDLLSELLKELGPGARDADLRSLLGREKVERHQDDVDRAHGLLSAAIETARGTGVSMPAVAHALAETLGLVLGVGVPGPLRPVVVETMLSKVRKVADYAGPLGGVFSSLRKSLNDEEYQRVVDVFSAERGSRGPRT